MHPGTVANMVAHVCIRALFILNSQLSAMENNVYMHVGDDKILDKRLPAARTQFCTMSATEVSFSLAVGLTMNSRFMPIRGGCQVGYSMVCFRTCGSSLLGQNLSRKSSIKW